MSAPSVQLSRLRDIGWNLWDPIGLKDVREFGCEDEYDTYLLQVVSRLKRRDSEPNVVRYLVEIESEHMGLGVSPSASARATATVAAIKSYLEACPDAQASGD
jgi:hypothetical protein